MPTYTFKDTITEEVFEKFLSMSGKEEYLEENPHIVSQITSPSTLIAGRSMDSGKLPEGFKDKLRLMKHKHPKANGVDHLI